MFAHIIQLSIYISTLTVVYRGTRAFRSSGQKDTKEKYTNRTTQAEWAALKYLLSVFGLLNATQLLLATKVSQRLSVVRRRRGASSSAPFFLRQRNPSATPAESGSQVKALAPRVTSCNSVNESKKRSEGARQDYAHPTERIRFLPCWLI